MQNTGTDGFQGWDVANRRRVACGGPRSTWLPRNATRGDIFAGEMECGHDSMIQLSLTWALGLCIKRERSLSRLTVKLTGSKEAAVRVRLKSKLRDSERGITREHDHNHLSRDHEQLLTVSPEFCSPRSSPSITYIELVPRTHLS